MILFWAGFVVVLGKDTSWDFRNYHWYAPYAFLNNRLGFDVAVAHQASYYNPFLDIPFYLLATHTHSWIALGVLGAVQGANVVPLYLIAREGLRIADKQAGGGRAGAARPVRRAHPHRIRHHLLRQCDERVRVQRAGDPDRQPRRAARRAAAARRADRGAGRACSPACAMGLKLPEMPFCVGFAAALLALGGSLKHQAARLVGGGIGGVLGFALFSAWWMLHMKALTGNPLFPYFNDYWHSPLALAAPYRDLRFVPTHFWREVFFPVLFSVDWHVADDLGFQDIRVCVAYFAVIAAHAAVGGAAAEPRSPDREPAWRCRCSPLRRQLFRLAEDSSPSIATSSRWRCWRRS